MNKLVFRLLPALLLVTAANASAQTPFLTADSINVNNINARLLVHGDMFWDPATAKAACEFPKGSGKHMNFASALWMAGHDGAGQLHVAAQTYRQSGNDYWPGPLTSAGPIDYATSQKWAKIWKVNRSDIEYFLSLPARTTTSVPTAILTWPARGNAHAAGNAGAPLTITEDMAPFVDANGNGIYEPLLGEYPDIPGDQALWWVFNDNGPTHTQSNGNPIGVEVRTMAYAYKRGTLIDNVIYLDYNAVNKSPNTYNNFRLALWNDVDLGHYLDDYVGFDSSWRLGITYNGYPDDGLLAGRPRDSYDTSVPVVGATMIVMPGDATGYINPVGSYLTYDNSFSILASFTVDTHFNHCMRSRAPNGVSMYRRIGVPLCRSHDSDRFYCYAGDPSDPASCTDCNLNNPTGDRRAVISTSDFTFPAGSTQHMVMAFITTNLGRGNGCPSVRFDSIRMVADTAWNNYYYPPTWQLEVAPLPGSQIHVYPNPAHDKLFVENAGNFSLHTTITLSDILGQTIAVPVTANNKATELDITALPPGLYILNVRSSTRHYTTRFLKR